MFWEKSYSQSQNIENLLQKEDVTIEDLLDDEDILQECKLLTRRLVQFLTRPDVIKRLITLTITEPPENLSVAERFRYSNIACEILISGIPSLDEKIVEDIEILQTLYSFLENEPPLNPLLAAFFSKTFSMLISRKSEQDWFLYQKMCLQLLEFIKSRGNFLDLIFKHFATPVITDLLLQIIKEVQGGTLKKNLYEWLTEQKLVERVISILGNPEEEEKHANVAEFLVDLIKYGRSMRQSDREDSLEQAFTGSDPLLQSIENEETIALLLDVMLKGAPKESSIVSGIVIVLTLVDEAIVDEPASDNALQKMIDKERDNHERVVSTVIHIIATRLQELHQLFIDPPTKNYPALYPTERVGLTRLEISRLFTVLIQTGNEQILNAVCETGYFNTLLKFFKQYSWNNFLHSEVEKCLGYVFACADQNDNEKNVETNVSALQHHVIINCKIISKLVDCWNYNAEMQSSQNGRRLGYMGHLIQILNKISLCVSKFDHIGALIESTLCDSELEMWKSLTDSETGDLSKELFKQARLLADCDPKAFNNDGIISDHDINLEVNLSDGNDDQGSPVNDSSMAKFYEFLDNDNLLLSTCDEIATNLQRQLNVWGTLLNDNLDDDIGFETDTTKSEMNTLSMTINPWGPSSFTDSATSGNDVGGWADFTSNNFADFETHFTTMYNSDFGDKFQASENNTPGTDTQTDSKLLIEKSDNNANIQTICFDNSIERPSELEVQNAKNVDLNVSADELTKTIMFNEVEKESESNGSKERESNPDENVESRIVGEIVISNGPTTLPTSTADGIKNNDKLPACFNEQDTESKNPEDAPTTTNTITAEKSSEYDQHANVETETTSESISETKVSSEVNAVAASNEKTENGPI